MALWKSTTRANQLEAEARTAIIAAAGRNNDTKMTLYKAVYRKAKSEGHAGLVTLFEGLKLFYEFQGGRTIHKLTEALHIYGRSLHLGAPAVLAHTEIGYALSGFENYQQAKLELQQAISLDPEYVRAQAILGHILMRTGDLEGADTIFQRAITLLPDFPCALFGKILLLLERGKTGEAENLCQWSRRRHPGNQFFELGEGLTAAAKEDTSGAVFWFLKVLDNSPLNIAALWGVLNAESKAEHHDRAVKYLRRILALDGPSPFMWATVAVLRWRRGENEWARSIVRKVMAQEEDTFQFRMIRRLIEAEGIN